MLISAQYHIVPVLVAISARVWGSLCAGPFLRLGDRFAASKLRPCRKRLRYITHTVVDTERLAGTIASDPEWLRRVRSDGTTVGEAAAGLVDALRSVGSTITQRYWRACGAGRNHVYCRAYASLYGCCANAEYKGKLCTTFFIHCNFNVTLLIF